MGAVDPRDVVLEGQYSMWDEALTPVVEAFPDLVPVAEEFLSPPAGAVVAPTDTETATLPYDELLHLAHTLTQHGWVVYPPDRAPRYEEARLGRIAKTARETSAKASESVARRAGSQAHKLLAVYATARESGLTNYEAGQYSGLAANPSCCYWKRCGELEQDGLLETPYDSTGQPLTRTATGSGEQQEVRRVTAAGLIELERLNERAKIKGEKK